MIKKILFSLALLSSLTFNSAFAESKILLESDTAWDGKIVSFRGKNLETVSTFVSIKPGEEIPFHCHKFPTLAYVTSGEVEVEKKDGKKISVKKGESLVEVLNTWHRGRNVSKTKPVEMVVFYLGTKKEADVTIFYSEENKNKCNN